MRRRRIAKPELSCNASRRKAAAADADPAYDASAASDPARRNRQRRPRQERVLPAGVALLLGGLILWLAVPRVLASAWLALRDPVIQQMDAGDPVAEAELLGLIASRELALGWVEDRETHDERASALAELAFRGDTQGAAERATLKRAIDATRAGLAAAPADPRDWTQLAYLLVLLEGEPSRSAAEALLASLRTGPFQAPDLLRTRLFWALAHWSFYDDEEWRQVGDQIRLTWRVAPGALADLALDEPEFFAPIAAALEEVPGERQQFVAALAFASPP